MTRLILALAFACVIAPAYAETCIASQYGVGDGYHGKHAANGSIFNTYATNPYTVAHKTHRFGTVLTITNLGNRRTIQAASSRIEAPSLKAAVWTSEGQGRTL
jgi:rare lipoprotein A